MMTLCRDLRETLLGYSSADVKKLVLSSLVLWHLLEIGTVVEIGNSLLLRPVVGGIRASLENPDPYLQRY